MTGWRGMALKSGIVLMYLGTVVTGMGLPFASALPVGLALFVAYTVLMRPVAQWGANPAMMVLTLLVLAALAALASLLGIGLAALLAPAPAWLGPALGIAGIALSRTAWSAGKAEELDALLDDAIDQVKGVTRDLERLDKDDDK